MHRWKTRSLSTVPVCYSVSYNFSHSISTTVTLKAGENSKVKGRFSKRGKKQADRNNKLIWSMLTDTKIRQTYLLFSLFGLGSSPTRALWCWFDQDAFDECTVQKQCFHFCPANDLEPHFPKTPNHTVKLFQKSFKYMYFIYTLCCKYIYFRRSLFYPHLGSFTFAMRLWSSFTSPLSESRVALWFILPDRIGQNWYCAVPGSSC